MTIDWSKQCPGVHRASFENVLKYMPEVAKMIGDTFPEDLNNYTFDIKVHMLMPGQFPCIPNWHYDNVPRINNVQDFNRVSLDKHMYLWISGAPLTEFKHKDKFYEDDRHTQNIIWGETTYYSRC